MTTAKLIPGPNGSFWLRFRSAAITLRSETMSRKAPKSTSRSSANVVPEPGRQFNPSRLTVARKRKGLTKIEFATRTGIPLRSFKAYELGNYPPPEDVIDRIASVSGFPTEFFFGDTLEEPREDTASFRSMSRLKPYQRSIALTHVAI